MNECIKCSACCKVWGLYELTKEDIKRLPKNITRKSHLYKDGRVMKTVGFKCIALTKKGCSIYNIRPAVCRNFKIRSIECNMARMHMGVDRK